jgi:ectoine hydroxylase
MALQTEDPYVSRLEHEELAPRQDPVLWAGRGGPLDAAQRAAYESRGFLALTPFDARETAAWREAALALAREADPRRPEVVTEPDSDVVRSIFRVHRDSGAFGELARDPRLLEVARELLGGDVYVHQSRLNFKPGFEGRAFAWHSDFETWHVEDGMPRMRAVSVSVALVENHVCNGPLMVVPGSHRTYVRCSGRTPERHYLTSLKRQEYGVPSREAVTRLVEEGGVQACAGPAGSATFFECNLMHGSAGNMTPLPRMNLFLVYNSTRNALQAPFGGLPPRPDFLGEREARALA